MTVTQPLRSWLRLLAVTGCVAFTLSCGSKGGSSGAPGSKVFQYFRSSAHKTLDPVKQFDAASAEIVANVYDTLLQYHYLKRPYTLDPNLLSKLPELNADGTVYIFELRDDVHFQDDPCFKGGKGRPLTSDDVIYSIKRFADANLNVQSYSLMQGFIEGMDEFREQTKRAGKTADYKKLQISGITKQDDRHFTIKLTRPNPLALLPLAATQLSIVPHEAVDTYKEEFERHPVGSGPFRIQALSPRGVTVLVKNPRYHLTYPSAGDPGDAEKALLAAAGKRLPFVDRVELPLIEEPQPAMLKFLSGQLDWIGMDKDNFVRMAYRDASGFHLKEEFAKKFALYAEPGLSMEYFSFNQKDPLLGKNKALRKAIAYAIDTPGYIAQMRNGRGIPLSSIVPIPIAGSQRDIKAVWYESSLEKARQQLAEAGYPEGKGLPPITLEYRASNTNTRQEFEYLRAQLAKVGITLKASFQTFSAFLQKVDTGNFQMVSAGWQADYPDAENFYQLLYGPNKSPGPNHGGYQNPEYDKLYEQTRFMPDGPERRALFERMHEIIREDVPIIFTWTPTTVGLHQRWVKNFKRNMMVDLPLKYLDLDAALKARGLR